MSDRSGSFSFANVTAVVADPSSSYIYVATSTGDVYKWDAATGATVATQHIGGNINALALSPDGTRLVAGQGNIAVGQPTVFENIAPSDLSYSTVQVSAFGASVNHLLVTNAGQVIFDPVFGGSGSSATWSFSLANPAAASTITGLYVPDGGPIYLSDGGRYVVVPDQFFSPPSLQLYDIQAQTLTGVGNAGRAPVAISETAGLIVSGEVVYDLKLNTVTDFTSFYTAHGGAPTAATFTPDGHDLLEWDATNNVVRVFDTHSWAQVGSMAMPAYQAEPFGVAGLQIGDHGQFLYAAGNGLSIDLVAKMSLTVTGTAGDDVLYGNVGSDTVSGGSGNDTIDGGGGDDTLDGGTGVNTVSYASATAGVTVSLALQGGAQNTVGAGNDTLSNFQNITGSAFADTLTGDGNANIIDGGAGNDTLSGGGGSDTFLEGANSGSDTITDFTVTGAAADKIDVSSLYRFGSLADVQAHATQSGADTVIDLGGSKSLTLKNVLKGDLVASDFVFTAVPLQVANTTITTDAGLTASVTSGPVVQFTDPNGGRLINYGSLSLNTSSASNPSAGITTAVQPEAAAVFENHGTFTVSSVLGMGVSAATTYNYGTFTVGGGLIGGTGSTGDFINYGTVQVSGLGTVTGDADQNYLFQNNIGATFQVSSSSDQAIGVNLSHGGQFTNDGTLTVSATASGIGLFFTTANSTSTIVNTGTITVTGSSSYGIEVNLNSSPGVSLENDGTINAQTGIFYSGSYATGTITNTGTINGAVFLGTGADHLVNSGTINGAVNMNGGIPDILDSHAGHITGTVTLGAGTDIVTLGSEDNTVVAGAGNHTINGGGGTNTISFASATTGVTVSLLTGTSQNTGVGSAALTNFQNLVGSSHNDVLTAGVQNGSLTGGAGADTFKFMWPGTVYTVTDFHAFEGDKIDLSSFTQFSSLSSVMNAAAQLGTGTLITLGNGGSLMLQGVDKSLLTTSNVILSSSGGTGGGTGSGGSGLKINVTYDSSVASAPAAFKTAVQAAVNFFQTTFTNNITINIGFGWGEVHNRTITGSVAESSALYTDNFNYQQVRAALAAADAGSATVSQAAAALPASDPTGGASFALNLAEQKALGLFHGSSSQMDGYVGLSSTETFTFDPNNRAVAGAYDAVGGIEHEISEILGRIVWAGSNGDDGPLDLFRYTAAGAHTFTAGPGSYFSLDNGATNLKGFNDGTNGGDDGDWASSNQVDASDAFGKHGVMSPISDIDVRLLELLGYTVSSNASVLGNPTVGPGVGGTPTTGPVAGGTLTGTAGDDWLAGQGGNDTLHGGLGSDYLDGGGGVNTATYDGASRQYTLTTAGSPETVVGGPEGGTDFLANIQRIQFVDGYLATGTADTAGQVYRIYEATLGRAPDQQGLANWVHTLNAGATLQSVVNGFVGSAEFQALYGNLSDTAFVTLLYSNVLHRAPDQAGLSSWVNSLAAGHSRAEVVTGFSESQEDIGALAAPVQQGLWIEDTAAGQVARLYDAVFGRLPDASGLVNWTHSLESGATLQSVAAGFVGSAEFQANYGPLSNAAFVTLLYNNVLHRAPDQTGLNNWITTLNSGSSRADVVLGFSESNEHVAGTAAHVDHGIWLG